MIFTSFGALAPRSVSDGCTDSKTPAISPVAGSTFAMEKTAWPFMAAADLTFSFKNSSAREPSFQWASCLIAAWGNHGSGTHAHTRPNLTSIGCGRKRHGIVVAGRCTPALGVQEGSATVRWHNKLAPKPIGATLHWDAHRRMFTGLQLQVGQSTTKLAGPSP